MEIRTKSRVTPGIRDYVRATVSERETQALSYDEAKQSVYL